MSDYLTFRSCNGSVPRSGRNRLLKNDKKEKNRMRKEEMNKYRNEKGKM
jgi:hypothetical protein